MYFIHHKNTKNKCIDNIIEYLEVKNSKHKISRNYEQLNYAIRDAFNILIRLYNMFQLPQDEKIILKSMYGSLLFSPDIEDRIKTKLINYSEEVLDDDELEFILINLANNHYH